jgi:hypothetical protein
VVIFAHVLHEVQSVCLCGFGSQRTGTRVTCTKKFNYFYALIHGVQNPFEPPLSFNMQEVAAVTNSCIIKDKETLKYVYSSVDHSGIFINFFLLLSKAF